MRYKIGDLCRADEDYIVHGCNAQGVMGSGVAKAIRESFPDAYHAYRKHYDTSMKVFSKVELATWSEYEDELTGKTIYNLVTQDAYGFIPKKYARYFAILNGLRYITYAHSHAHGRAEPFVLAMPLIGCGLGGLKWDVLRPLLEELEEDLSIYKVEFVVYSLDGKDF